LVDFDKWSAAALGSVWIDFDALNGADFYAIAAAGAGVEEFLLGQRAGGTQPNAGDGSQCGGGTGGWIVLLGARGFGIKRVDLADHLIQRAAGLNQGTEKLTQAVSEKIAAV
jgi:hypothetical protein